MNKPFVGNMETKDSLGLKLALFSDLHIGADDIDIKRMRKDLSQACNEDRRLSINGDIAELVLPTDRKRYTASKSMSQRDDIINEALEMCFAELKPYADYLDVIGTGNHDEAPIKYDSFDLVGALCVLLNRERSKTLPPIHRASYQGYMQYKIRYSSKTIPFTIYHHHGAGGASPVTKGMIDFNRVVYTHDADLYWIGHKHTAIQDNGIMKDGLNAKGNYYQKVCKGVFTAGYKTQQIEERKGYHIKYSDGFYNLQATGYAIVDVYINKRDGFLEHFDVLSRT